MLGAPVLLLGAPNITRNFNGEMTYPYALDKLSYWVVFTFIGLNDMNKLDIEGLVYDIFLNMVAFIASSSASPSCIILF